MQKLWAEWWLSLAGCDVRSADAVLFIAGSSAAASCCHFAISLEPGPNSGQKHVILALPEFPWQFRSLKPVPSRETEGTVLRVPEHVRKTNSPDGGIILDVKHGRMFTLNLVGSRILELLEHQYTTAHIAEELSREFGIAADVAMRDIEEFVATLEKHHLIDAHSSGPTV
jgi:Coenzyme PQQ synthesis protein D (PqqD)